MKLEVLKQTVEGSLNGTLKFPQIVGMLLDQKVEAYHVDFVKAENRYYNAEGEYEMISLQAKYPNAASEFSAALVSAAIKKSQQGLIDYKTFVKEVMAAGCVYYIAYLSGKRVIYLGRNGDHHIEYFPK